MSRDDVNLREGHRGEDVEPGMVVVPGARLALALLLGINLFNYIDRYVLAAVIPHIRASFFGDGGAAGYGALGGFLEWFQKSFGFKPENALIGSLSMAFMVTYMVAAPVFGKLAERWSRWLLVGIGVLLWSLASGASGLAGSFLVLLVTRCFVGIGEAAYGPVAPTVISDFYPIQVRGRVLAWFYLAIPVGSALGFILGEQFAKSSLGWRWAFYAVVPPGLLLGLWSLFMKEPGRAAADLALQATDPGAAGLGERGKTPSGLPWKSYLVLLRTPSYVLNTLGMSAMTFAVGGIGFWMVDYVQEVRHARGPAATIFGAITVVSGLSATLLGGMAGDRLRGRFPGSYFLVSGGAMLLGFPFFLAVLWLPFPGAWGAVFAACFCLFFNTGPSNTILANVTHPAIRAGAFALNIFVIHALGDVISPLIIGALSDRYSMGRAFLVVALMILVSGSLWLWGARYLAEDTRKAMGRLRGEEGGRE